MHRIVFAFLLLTTTGALAEPALTVSCADQLFAKDSSHARLVAAFGKQNVTLVSEQNGPGIETKSVIYPKDPKRKLTIVWSDPKARGIPETAIIEKPSQWTAPNGVHIGSPLAELEQLNGKPFLIGGFGAFLGSQADWNGGALNAMPGGCFIVGSLEPTAKLAKPLMDKLSGNANTASTDPVMRQAQPVMSKLMVAFKAAR